MGAPPPGGRGSPGPVRKRSARNRPPPCRNFRAFFGVAHPVGGLQIFDVFRSLCRRLVTELAPPADRQPLVDHEAEGVGRIGGLVVSNRPESPPANCAGRPLGLKTPPHFPAEVTVVMPRITRHPVLLVLIGPPSPLTPYHSPGVQFNADFPHWPAPRPAGHGPAGWRSAAPPPRRPTPSTVRPAAGNSRNRPAARPAAVRRAAG